MTDACKKHGGFYLGSIGGPAALLAQENIKKVELLEYPELGMEAIYKIEVVDFPAFILVDDKGNEFFAQLPVHRIVPTRFCQSDSARAWMVSTASSAGHAHQHLPHRSFRQARERRGHILERENSVHNGPLPRRIQTSDDLLPRGLCFLRGIIPDRDPADAIPAEE